MAASPARTTPSARKSRNRSRPTSTFADLRLPPQLVGVLETAGVNTPFPIQSATIPPALEGRDVLGRGRTGSGKTYAFLLPLVTRVAAEEQRPRPTRPRAVIVAPTRELATQIDKALKPLAAQTRLRTVTVFGGVPAGRQIEALRKGVDVVVACPGRLNDLMRSGHADLRDVAVTVLDEADHMADLGFLPDVRRILDATPRDSQRLLFSATLDRGVDVLVKRYLSDPVVHSVDSVEAPVSSMEHHVLHVTAASRVRVITDLAAAPGKTVVFTRTKFAAKNLARKLNASGISAVELHGNLSQNVRSRNLARFTTGAASTLVATDIAARGIHVDDVALVIHADPPVEHKAYLHRSGRTARAGAAGTVVTMVLDHQTRDVRAMTRKAGISPVITRADHAHPVLRTIAPGERTFGQPVVAESVEERRPRNRRPGKNRSAGSTANGSARRRGRPQRRTSARAHSAASFSASR